jgi:hypothetical protein
MRGGLELPRLRQDSLLCGREMPIWETDGKVYRVLSPR